MGKEENVKVENPQVIIDALKSMVVLICSGLPLDFTIVDPVDDKDVKYSVELSEPLVAFKTKYAIMEEATALTALSSVIEGALSLVTAATTIASVTLLPHIEVSIPARLSKFLINAMKEFDPYVNEISRIGMEVSTLHGLKHTTVKDMIPNLEAVYDLKSISLGSYKKIEEYFAVQEHCRLISNAIIGLGVTEST